MRQRLHDLVRGEHETRRRLRSAEGVETIDGLMGDQFRPWSLNFSRNFSGKNLNGHHEHFAKILSISNFNLKFPIKIVLFSIHLC